MTLRRPLPLLSCLLWLTLPGAAAAQECADGTISHIFVDNHSIFDLDELPTERLTWVYRLANALHIRTRESFIRRELLFQEGDCYQPFLLQDSERILRRFPFISNAEVYALQQSDGSWHVVADTRDEWSTRLEVTAEFEDGVDLRRIALSELNFLGYGTTVTAFYNQSDASREVGAEFLTPQLFGTETDLRLGGGSTRVGESFRGGLTYPFVGEVGRLAWRAYGSTLEDYFDYSTAGEDRVLLPFREELLELTLARRFGEPGNLTVLGVGVSREAVSILDFPDGVRVAPDGDFSRLFPADQAVLDALAPQTFFASGTRVNLLFGQRNIRFVQRQGLDALRGITDVEVGSDIALTLSRTVSPVFGLEAPEDLNVRFRFYAGAAPRALTVVTNVAVDGRQVFFDPGTERSGWRDVLAEGDLFLYWQPPKTQGHTVLARVVAAGGWTVDRPFQLTLGGRTGVRGYDAETFPGARRIVLNLEDRIYLGWPLPDLVDLGVTLFGDVGRVWAGDVPFGVDSGWRGSVGAGLRIGFPAGSRDVARIDLAWPVDGGGFAGGPVLRIALVDLIGLEGGLEDMQLERSRLLGVGPDRFSPAR